ncbi:MAG: hypothetical protein ACJ797_01070 [Ktedonobacteraceae bacterium]
MRLVVCYLGHQAHVRCEDVFPPWWFCLSRSSDWETGETLVVTPTIDRELVDGDRGEWLSFLDGFIDGVNRVSGYGRFC